MSNSYFSGALQLTDFDDFITPSLECIKPVTVQTSTPKSGAKISLQYDNYPEYQVGKEKLQKVSISLQDCLACSGCITSAESMLITQQSQDELLKILDFKRNVKTSEDNLITNKVSTVVFTVSVQSVLSLAERYNLSVEKTARHLSGYLRHLGADYILNSKIADDLALLECREEFLKRFREHQQEETNHVLPMLTSSCPGWVCYAEKTHGNFILPYISTTRSPQQIMGILIKQLLAIKLGVLPQHIFHVSVMPCYDKKLEASRQDFFNEKENCRDVDFVITTIEIEQMLAHNSIESYPTAPFDFPWHEDDHSITETQFMWAHETSTSGGYSEYIFKYAAKKLFDMEISELHYKILRNADFREITLERNGECLLRFAIANGFRNIQNLVQKLKRGKVPYHFVEVMACPAGCINGGAQIRPRNGQSVRELATHLEKLYQELPQSNPDNNVIKNVYENFFQGKSHHTEKATSLLHTSYHAVEKINSALNIKW